MQPCNRI